MALLTLPRLALWAALVAALSSLGCSETVPPSDAPDAANDLGPVDVPSGADVAVTPDATPDRPLPPDDVDRACTNGATDRCLNYPPGPCVNLAGSAERTVRFAGFARDYAFSCAGRVSSMGPDAVIPLTLREASDVSITLVPGNNDTVVGALVPAGACGDTRRELQCVNGSFSIGGIAVLRASSVPAGEYALLVGTAMGINVQVSASVVPARPRNPGDLCPGVVAVPDGAPARIDTRRFPSTADYGTSCGYNGSGGLGWVDAVVRFTTTTTRDVSVQIDGDGREDVNVEVATVCGSRAFIVPGCEQGLPARRLLRNLPAGTYFAVIDYRPMTQPDHQLTVTVVTAPPTPPGPAARCPGVPLAEGALGEFDADTLTPEAPLTCISNQRASAFVSFVAPEGPSDVLVNVQTTAPRNSAAMQLRAPCDGDAVGACVGPLDRTARSVWNRYQNLTPGQTYYVQASTDASSGQLLARWGQIPVATSVRVEGNTVCADAPIIPPGGGIFTGTTERATMLTTPTCASAMTGCAGSRTAVYRLDLTERRRVVASMDGEGFDALLAIQPGDTCPGRPSMGSGACTDDWYGTDPQIDVTLNAGRYWVHVGGCGTSQSGPYELDVAILPP